MIVIYFCPTPSLCPAHLRSSIDAYVHEGRPTGSFLRAVLENDLRAAMSRADHVNLTIVHHVIAYVEETAPEICWGSAEKVRVHLELKMAERAELAREAEVCH